MIIEALSVKDFKGVKNIRLQNLKPGLVIVTGKNGSGKSSLLDAIEQGLRGGKATCAKPIRNGATSAEIQFDLGELEVKRTYKEGKAATVKVRNKKNKTTAGQKVLDMLLNARTMDPTTFLQLDGKKQSAEFQKALGLDFTEVDAAIEKAYNERTFVNRDLDNARGAVENLPHHDDAPEAEYSLLDLTNELSEVQKLANKVEGLLRDEQAARNSVASCDKEIAALEAQLAALKQERGEHAERAKAAETDHKVQADLLAKCRDVDAIEADIEGLEEKNQKARDNKAYARAEAEVERLEKESEKLTGQVNEGRRQREKMLQDAKCPIEGLAITDDGVTLKGVPLEQCSQAEQLRVGFEVARLINPDLKVICCREGSNLDDDAIKFLSDLALSHGYQFWIEMVRTDEDNALEIREGELV